MKPAVLSAAPVALLLALGACGGDGNSGRPAPNIELWSQVPWANHATPQFEPNSDGSRGSVLVSTVPFYPAIGSNAADPGSHEVDCSVLEGIELSPYWVQTFEPSNEFLTANGTLPSGEPKAVGVATAWSSYDDGSDGSFRVPGDVDWYPGLKGAPYVYDAAASPWGLAADHQSGARPMCDGAANDWVLHYRGGRFNYYGGGMAHPFAPFADACRPGSDFCSASGNAWQDETGPGYQQLHQFWDGSAYDGVVFWARRGPDGVPGLLVGLQDKYTSDDLARENQKYCKRIKPCVPTCVNGFECGDDGLSIQRCMPRDPIDSSRPGYNVVNVSNPALRDFLFPRCGASTCTSRDDYRDVDLDGTECQPHSFTGLSEGYWCGDATHPIAPPSERCGDGFVAPISLSTDWQLYKLPFGDFRQVGFGKKAPVMDLKTLYSIAFQFTVGYADVYVDNVSFYRNK
jgi:hypothetical protein